jgi:hypothetical protein
LTHWGNLFVVRGSVRGAAAPEWRELGMFWRRLWLLGMVILASSGTAFAEPITLLCSPAASNGDGMGAADLLVLDREVPSLELAVASSLGTDAPLNWVFVTRPDEGLGPDAIVMETVYDTLVGGGHRGPTSYSFLLDMSDFWLTSISTYGVEQFRWTCSPS